MRLVKAGLEDSEKINRFFESTSLPGPISLSLKRPKGFFHPYKLQSDRSATYILIDNQDEVSALATIIFKEGWVQGKKETIGYATDLRVSSSRSAVLKWSQYFLSALEAEREAHNCKYIFSVVAQGQRQAFNAFLRPRSIKRKMPRYFSFRPFKIVSLYGIYPFSHRPLKSIKIEIARAEDRSHLFDYILKQNQTKPYHYANSHSDLDQSLKRWESLKLSDFWIAKDSQGEIVGCTAPWSSHEFQTWVPTHFSRTGKSLQETLHFTSFFRLTHKFGKKNKPLNFKFLTHLHADNPDVFYSLLWHTFQNTDRNHFLVYTHFENHLITTPPRQFIHSTYKANLYSILSPTETPPEILRPTTFAEPPDFELAFL